MTSLRGQLTIWFIGLLTAVGILTGLGAGYVSLSVQDGLLDDQLRQIALSVGDTPSAAGESYRITAGANPEDRIVVHILDAAGKIIRNSDPSAEIPMSRQTGFSDHLDGDIVWRTFTLVTENRIIQVSQETEVRKNVAWESAFNTVLPIALLIPLSWLVVGLVVRRLLRPLRNLADELRAMPSAQRVKLPDGGLPIEVKPLVGAVNDLLERQHELLAFRERFVSDAAHQLRTPLTALTLQLQNLKQDLPQDANPSTVAAIEAGLARMSALLSQLFNLARAEAPGNLSIMEQTELGRSVRTAIADVIEVAVRRQIDLGLTADSDVTVTGNEVDVTMLIGNLLDNAVRYTPAGGAIDVEISRSGDDVTVHVRDTGPGIPEPALAQVFGRFYRCAPADSEGSGLGLSIVQALAQRLGAGVKLANRSDGPGLDAAVIFRAVG